MTTDICCGLHYDNTIVLASVLLNNEKGKMWQESVVEKLISVAEWTEVNHGKLGYDSRCSTQPRFELYTLRLSLRSPIS